MAATPIRRRSGAQRRQTPSGFTLIEVLVVLILVAMISGVLFQALERAYGLQRRFGTELFRAQQGQMATDWYRQTVQGLYPDQADGPNLFKGSDKGFVGLSVNPLGLAYGAPTPIQWSVRPNLETGTTDLVYAEGGRETSILAWRGKAAKMVYFDAEQKTHDRWPPALGLFPQLPSQIQLWVEDRAEPVVIVATPMGLTQPNPRPQDVFGILP